MTVSVKPVPAVAEAGALTLNLLNAAGLTVNVPLVPVVEPSVAVMLTPVPDVVTVTETVLVPLANAPLEVGLIDPAE